MFSRVLAIWGLLFLRVSSALDPSYFTFEESDCSYSLYQEIMDIFTESPDDTVTGRAIGLVTDNLEDFSLPIKRLHEDGNMIVLDQNEPIFVDSSFVEIHCGQRKSRGILDDILPRVILSFTIVVILKDSQELYFNEIEACMLEVFNKFWEQGITNIVIVFSNNYKMSEEVSPTPSKTFSYVYEPYHENPLRNVTGLNFRKIFYDKTANLHLHPLKVLAHRRQRFFFDLDNGISHLAGIDGSLTEMFGQIFNATVTLIYRIDRDKRSSDKDLQEQLKWVANGSVDVWMNIRIMNPEASQGVAYSYPRERLDIICILPKNVDGHTRGLFGGRVLSLLIWMIAVFSVVSFLVFLVNKMLLQNMPLLKLAKVVLNQSDNITQKPFSTTMRILFGSWIAGSLVYSTLLQTLITARIIRPTVEKRMISIRDVIESDIDLRIEQTYWVITKNHYDPALWESIQKNVRVVADDELFNVQDPDVGYLATRDAMEYVNTEHRAYVLQETFLPNLAAYYFPEKSPFISRFNKALSSLTETGIPQKWVADNHHRLQIDSKMEKPITPVKYIGYTNLKSVIYIYAAGMSIAFVVFIVEVKFQ